MPLMWKTRNSRGERMPAGVIQTRQRAIFLRQTICWILGGRRGCAEKRNVSFNPLRRGSFSVSCDRKTINQQPCGNDSLSLTIGHGLKVRRSGELCGRRFFLLFGAWRGLVFTSCATMSRPLLVTFGRSFSSGGFLDSALLRFNTDS